MNRINLNLGGNFLWYFKAYLPFKFCCANSHSVGFGRTASREHKWFCWMNRDAADEIRMRLERFHQFTSSVIENAYLVVIL